MCFYQDTDEQVDAACGKLNRDIKVGNRIAAAQHMVELERAAKLDVVDHKLSIEADARADRPETTEGQRNA